MNIEEGNKFIAEFMGGELVEFIDLSNSNCTAFKMNNSIYPFYSLAYHSSWDWLMPVVEKIEQLGYDTNIISYLGENITIISEGTPQGDGGKYTENIADETAETKIQTTWQAVVQFIEWYNKQQSVKESLCQ